MLKGILSKGKESGSSHVDKQGISSMQSVTPSEECTVEPRYYEVPRFRKKNVRYSKDPVI